MARPIAREAAMQLIFEQLFGGVGGNKRVYHIAYIAVQKALKGVERKSYAVVADASLAVVVGAYALASVACSYLIFSIGCDLFILLGELYIVKLGFEHFQSFVTVFELTALLLTFDNYARGLVG